MISFIALWAGNYVSAFFIRMHIAEKATIAAGLILIAIGVEQILVRYWGALRQRV